MIESLFSPGRKHATEERRRLELTRVDAEGADPGRGPIDLSSGKVTIRVGGDAGEAAPAALPDPEGAPDAPSASSAATPTDGTPGTG